jgi:hypothetical protein
MGVLVAYQVYLNARSLADAAGDGGVRVFLLIFWVVFFAFALSFVKRMCTLRLTEDRIETPKLVSGMVRTPWCNLTVIDMYSEHVVFLETSEGKVVLNLSVFQHPRQILTFIVEHLPEDVEVPTSVTKARVKKFL